MIDALSSYAIYQEGIVEKPVVCNDHLQTFADHGVPNLWTYYCTVQAIDVPNRFIAMPSARNRIWGCCSTCTTSRGSLHWGFNFYNSQRSVRHIDPFRVTDAGGAFPLRRPVPGLSPARTERPGSPSGARCSKKRCRTCGCCA